MFTPDELHLLKKLSSGALDGMVGDEREYRSYHSVFCGKLIRNGIPISYQQNEPARFSDGQENELNSGDRTEKTYDTDEKKLEFLQRFGWLIDDEEVRAYSARFKPGRKDGR